MRLRVRAGMGLRQHLQEWTQLTQALHSLFEKPFGFDPVVEVALHRPLLAGGRQDGRHPIADQDEEDIIEVALGAVRLHEGFHAPGLRRQKALALGIHAQPLGRLPPPGGELHPLRRSEHRYPKPCGPRIRCGGLRASYYSVATDFKSARSLTSPSRCPTSWAPARSAARSSRGPGP